VKPQFEVGRPCRQGGIVRNDTLRREAVDRVAAFAAKSGTNSWRGGEPRSRPEREPRGVFAPPVDGTRITTEYLRITVRRVER